MYQIIRCPTKIWICGRLSKLWPPIVEATHVNMAATFTGLLLKEYNVNGHKMGIKEIACFLDYGNLD